MERALGEGIYQQSSPRTISDLLGNTHSIDSLTALAPYMHHAGRLHLIAGEQDPEVSDSVTAEEYLRIGKLIAAYYSVVLTDCGTGDRGVADGDLVTLDVLKPEIRRAYKDIAAAIVDGYQ